MRKKLILLLIVGASISTVFGKVKPTVIIAPFTPIGEVTENDTAAVTELFTSQLVMQNKFQVIERRNLDSVIEELRFQIGDWSSDTNKVQAVGKAINAQYIIRGQLMKLGKEFFLSTTLLKIEGFEVVSASQDKFNYLGDVLSVIPSLVSTMTEKLVPTQNYKIGAKGPGGGIIFMVEGSMCSEVSQSLGFYNWNDACGVAGNYNGGGVYDWYLPSKDELRLISQKLVQRGFLQDYEYHWSSSEYGAYNAWDFNLNGCIGSTSSKHSTKSVRAVRTFYVE